MFDNLLESKPKKKRSVGQTVLSFVVHGLLAFGAVKATQGAVEAAKEIKPDTTMVFLKPPPPPPPPPQNEPPPDVVVSQNPPPKGFQTVVPPTDIPKEIPPVNLNEKPFDPKDFTGKGVEGGVAAGIVGGTGPVDVQGQVYSSTQLDDPASVISMPSPRYPPAMAAAGIAGRVVLQFIIDTEGKAEATSFKVISTTHPAFVEPAKEAVMKATFKPGRSQGKPVRQLVEQAINFSANAG
ncbi:MAG TPA: TonB family protein [Gemmatimonadales bacterium]|nr:TonB family protein [Gemmatimonadales bacterium]